MNDEEMRDHVKARQPQGIKYTEWTDMVLMSWAQSFLPSSFDSSSPVHISLFRGLCIEGVSDSRDLKED